MLKKINIRTNIYQSSSTPLASTKNKYKIYNKNKVVNINTILFLLIFATFLEYRKNTKNTLFNTLLFLLFFWSYKKQKHPKIIGCMYHVRRAKRNGQMSDTLSE